jgi:hypothetical protein
MGKIDGREATYVAIEGSKREPIRLEPAPDGNALSEPTPMAHSERAGSSRPTPPRVRKPSRNDDRCLAPASNLEEHRAALRRVFGGTLSDEFAEVMLGKLVEALRPGPFDALDEASLNAAIALVASVNPQTELEAILAVEIAATGFTGLKFLRQSQRHMDEIFIGVYGGYAMKLLRLQLELVETLDRHRRGNKQVVEVRHVHIHQGLGVSSGSSTPRKGRKTKNDGRPHAPECGALTVTNGSALRSTDARGRELSIARGPWSKEMPDARGRKRLRWPPG